MNYLTLKPSQTIYLSIEGYFFERLEYVILSATRNTFFPYVCTFNFLTENTKLSSVFLTVSGYPLSSFSPRGNNNLAVSVEGNLANSGKYDLIFANDAGYTKLSNKNYLLSSII